MFKWQIINVLGAVQAMNLFENAAFSNKFQTEKRP